jgi:hypothetical protein
MNSIKIIIDPNNRILYSSYYIKGLIDLFGKRSIKFSSKPFFELKVNEESHSFDHYFAFIILQENNSQKIIIDFRDKRSIKHSAYEWCDKYAKINFSKETTPLYYQKKIISIPPGFGIKLWDIKTTIFYAVTNLLKSWRRLSTDPFTFILNYSYMYHRPTLDDYITKDTIEENYIFFISNLWTHQNCVENTNPKRYMFIKKCVSNPNLSFEGGLLATHNNPEYNKYQDYVLTKSYNVYDYLIKTKKSILTFNTPAVFDCHGWKLGEFMAMGKAIISTTLTNELPMALEDGVHVCFANDNIAIGDMIEKIRVDITLRKKLETNITKYYNEFASPKAVISHIIYKSVSIKE